MSDNAVEQTTVVLDEEDTGEGALEQNSPDSNKSERQTSEQRPVVSSLVSNASVKRKLKVIITLKVSS